ncbi:metallophosphoesterase [Arthrobacter sp. H14]|uniref:metallophosphoesterase n=1 Tax=Arthrobacter sp. H14 TaxID=1312959 RepID=UPI0004BA77D5|nr:metallophosphoesterase [Arthrobacter sp. H14]
MRSDIESHVKGWRLSIIIVLGVVIVVVLMALLYRHSSGPAALNDEPDGAQSAAVSREVLFTASGDYSASDAARSVFEQINEIDPDLHLALGDFSYGETETEQDWCNLVTSAVGQDFPFQLLAGDHESDGDDGHIDAFTGCLPNQLPGLEGDYGRQWYVDVPKEDPLVRFVMISPGLDFDDNPLGLPGGNDPLAVPFGADTRSYEEGSQRYKWTANAIDGAQKAAIPWVVVGMHAPCLSLGEYPCTSGADINNLMLEKGVDLVVHGDEHLYQRTHLLAAGPECSAIKPGTFLDGCRADDDASMTKETGTVFITVGTGGTGLRDVHANDPEAPYFAAASGANMNPSFGSLEVRITSERLSGHFRPAIGDFTDTFRLAGGRG